MTQLYLIRHAEYTYSPEKEYDRGLTASGIKQAERLRDRLALGEIQADVLIASTAPRARQTAEIIAPALNLPLQQEADLQEWSNIEGTSMTGQEFLAQMRDTPYDQRPFYALPNSESWAQFSYRAALALNRLVEQHQGQKIVLVCHGGIIETAFLLFFGFSPWQPSPVMMLLNSGYTSITLWHKIKGFSYPQWMLQYYNDTSHLRQDFQQL